MVLIVVSSQKSIKTATKAFDNERVKIMLVAVDAQGFNFDYKLSCFMDESFLIC